MRLFIKGFQLIPSESFTDCVTDYKLNSHFHISVVRTVNSVLSPSPSNVVLLK